MVTRGRVFARHQDVVHSFRFLYQLVVFFPALRRDEAFIEQVQGLDVLFRPPERDKLILCKNKPWTCELRFTLSLGKCPYRLRGCPHGWRWEGLALGTIDKKTLTGIVHKLTRCLFVEAKLWISLTSTINWRMQRRLQSEVLLLGSMKFKWISVRKIQWNWKKASSVYEKIPNSTTDGNKTSSTSN